MRRAFTWAEFLVILVVLILVSALATPIFLHAREAAGRARCLSNLRAISTSLHAYVSANSETFPLAMPADEVKWYPEREANVPADASRDRVFWANAIGVSEEHFQCPAINGFPFNYNGYLHAVPKRRLADPNNTIAVWEGFGKAGAARSSPGLDCGTVGTECGYFAGTPTIAEVPRGSAWTHGRGANFLLLDGHAKWRRLGQQTGVPTDRSKDPFHIYDNAGKVDKFWLDEDGRAVLFKLN